MKTKIDQSNTIVFRGNTYPTYIDSFGRVCFDLPDGVYTYYGDNTFGATLHNGDNLCFDDRAFDNAIAGFSDEELKVSLDGCYKGCMYVCDSVWICPTTAPREKEDSDYLKRDLKRVMNGKTRSEAEQMLRTLLLQIT